MSLVAEGARPALLAAVRTQDPSGPRLAAFFGVLYYSGLRPEEAVSLRRQDVTLPDLAADKGTLREIDQEGAWASFISDLRIRTLGRSEPTTAQLGIVAASSSGQTARRGEFRSRQL